MPAGWTLPNPGRRVQRPYPQGHPADPRAELPLASDSPSGEGGSSVRDACLEELTDTECRNLLAERHLGRLALVDAQGPVIFPVNYVFDQGSVVFRTDAGTKLDAAADATPVAFEVDAVH